MCVCHIYTHIYIRAYLHTQDCTWHDITVDTRIPCKHVGEDEAAPVPLFIPTFGRCVTASHMWVPILEKAFAKLYGSYGALQGGQLQLQ
jgi:hypothetical protein